MGKGFQGAVLKTLGAKEHLLTVTGKEFLAPHFVRIQFTTQTLLRPEGENPASWVRLWFPDTRGGDKLYQRGYTIAESDPAKGTLSIDFVVHEPAGPASSWAKDSTPGDQITAMRYGGDQPFKLLDPAPEGYLFLGDLAALPAIRSAAAIIPAGNPVRIFLENHDPHDREVPLPKGEDISVEWLAGGGGFDEVLAAQSYAGWYAWVTAEMSPTRCAKNILKKQHGLDRKYLHPQAYWVKGRQMGTSRG